MGVHTDALPPKIPGRSITQERKMSRMSSQPSLLPLSHRSAPNRPSSSKAPTERENDGHRFLVAKNRSNSAPRLGRSSTLPKLIFSQHQSMRSVFSEADSEKYSGRTTSRVITTVELMKNPQGPPLDYSFLEICDIEELKTLMPNSGFRKQPPATITDAHGDVSSHPLLSEWHRQKAPIEGTVTQGLKLSNNQLSQIPYQSSYIFREIMEKPHWLRWIDLSFNMLEEIPAVLAYYAHLTTVYLHANRIQDPAQIHALSGLKELRAVTMHGNPCEEVADYRLIVLAACAGLKKLDFGSVTKADRERAVRFSQTRKHRAILANLKSASGQDSAGAGQTAKGLRQPQGLTVAGPAAARSLASASAMTLRA